MKITVTQEHIDQARKEAGSRAQCYVCPIAQALIATGQREVSVAKEYASWFTPDGRAAWGDLPDIAIEWIQAYDEGRYVMPFEFELGLELT